MRRLARLAERRPDSRLPVVVVVLGKGSRPVREVFRFKVEELALNSDVRSGATYLELVPVVV